MSGITAISRPITKAADASAGTGKRTGLLLALFATGFATFVNLYATQPLLPQFQKIFHASELLVSLTVSASVLAVALAAPMVGLLADRLGRKRVIITAMLGLSLPTALASTAADLGQLIMWRFLQGLFIPGIITVTMAYISEEAPRGLIGTTMSTYITGTVVGGFAGRFIAGLCAAHYGWRVAFIYLAAITIAGFLTTLWLLPRATKFVRQPNTTASLDALRQHLRNPQLLATYAIGFNILFCMVGAFTYVNFYLADRPFLLGPAVLGAIFSVYLIGAAITPVAGVILDRVGYRRTLKIAAVMVAAGVLLTLIHMLPIIITGLALIATGVFASQAAASSYVGEAAGRARSSAAGLYVALYYFGGSVGSVLPGFFWGRAGWTGCVILILCVQAVIFQLAARYWKV
jgi:YNFM family putative membrane transporter